MRLYDVRAVARHLDVTERRVRQLRDKGVIQEYRGMAGLYDLTATNHNYINYLRKRNPDSEDNLDYNTERAKLIRAKRLNEEYDLGVKEGSLHAAADIESVLAGMLINFKSRLMAIPSKLSPVLSIKSDKSEIFTILKANIDEALDELADFDTLFKEAVNEGEVEDENGYC